MTPSLIEYANLDPHFDKSQMIVFSMWAGLLKNRVVCFSKLGIKETLFVTLLAVEGLTISNSKEQTSYTFLSIFFFFLWA